MKYFCRTVHDNDVKSPNDNVITLALYFYSVTARSNLFFGYLAHIVRRERDGIIAEDLQSYISR